MIKKVKTTNVCDYQLINGKKLKSFSYSIDGTTDPKVLKAQADVFEKFNMPLNQVIHDTFAPDMHNGPMSSWNQYMGHSIFLNMTMWTEEADYYVFWDLDCIPLEEGINEYIVDHIKDGNSIIGAAQSAMHIQPDHIYAGPMCLGLSKEAWVKCNRPWMGPTNRSDVGQELTRQAEANGVNVYLMHPTDVEEPKWKLGDGTDFGLGTTYENKIYHAFESRFGFQRFLDKCNEVLG